MPGEYLRSQAGDEGALCPHPSHSLTPLLCSILRHEPLVRRTPDRVLLLFQLRANVNDWVRGVLAAVLGLGPSQRLPPLVFQAEGANLLGQPQQLLEGVAPGQWLLFEQVLWPKDMFFGGNRGVESTADAHLLRALLHTMHGSVLPPAGALPPPVITLQRKSANRRIVNEGEVVAMLREFGEVSAPGGLSRPGAARMPALPHAPPEPHAHHACPSIPPGRCAWWSLDSRPRWRSSCARWAAQACTCRSTPPT